MDDPEHSEHGPAHGAAPSGQTMFPEEEWKEYRAQDMAAAKYIVGLMLGIFALGLLLYIGVALWVAARAV